MHKHDIYGFVGPSGSGKSTLIIKLLKLFPHLQIIKSTSTRPRRDDTDDLFYDFIAVDQFQKQIDSHAFINYHEYAQNWYGTNLNDTKKVLACNCGTFALVENAVAAMRAAEIPLKLIKILPEKDGQLVRASTRADADKIREQIQLDFDLTVTNSFKPGGLEKSIKILSDYFHKEFENNEN
jgi:guanylate kinase